MQHRSPWIGQFYIVDLNFRTLAFIFQYPALHAQCKLKMLGENPSSIYSWSIDHILEHEFFCLGHLGCACSKGKKVDLSFSEQLLRVVYSTF